MKITLAFIVAALTPAILMTLWYLYGEFTTPEPDYLYIWVGTMWFFIPCATISTAYVLLLGLPTYMILQWRNAVHWWYVLVSGFILAASPIALWSWPLRYPELKTNASIDGVQTMISGMPTVAGWLQYAEGVSLFGACGAISGMTFWLVLRALSPNNSFKPNPLPGSA